MRAACPRTTVLQGCPAGPAELCGAGPKSAPAALVQLLVHEKSDGWLVRKAPVQLLVHEQSDVELPAAPGRARKALRLARKRDVGLARQEQPSMENPWV